VRSVISGKELGVKGNAEWARGVGVKFAGPVEVVEVTAVKA
jgi:hypothetical protein